VENPGEPYDFRHISRKHRLAYTPGRVPQGRIPFEFPFELARSPPRTRLPMSQNLISLDLTADQLQAVDAALATL